MMNYRGLEVSGLSGAADTFRTVATGAAQGSTWGKEGVDWAWSTPPATGPAANPGFWNALIGGTAALIGGQQATDQARANAKIAAANARASGRQVEVSSGTPSWLVPAVAVGGVALIAAVVYAMKK